MKFLKFTGAIVGGFIGLMVVIGAIAGTAEDVQSTPTATTTATTASQPTNAPKATAKATKAQAPKPKHKAPKPQPKPAEPAVDQTRLNEARALLNRGVTEFDEVQKLTTRGQVLAGGGQMDSVCITILPELEQHIDKASQVIQDLRGYDDVTDAIGGQAQIAQLESTRDQMQNGLGRVQDMCA